MNPRPLAAVYLSLFAVLILAGVAVKRLLGHPEFMMLFHLPAAVFLVLGGMELKKAYRAGYEAEIREVEERLAREESANRR